MGFSLSRFSHLKRGGPCAGSPVQNSYDGRYFSFFLFVSWRYIFLVQNLQILYDTRALLQKLGCEDCEHIVGPDIEISGNVS
jgi:hypothetical protein